MAVARPQIQQRLPFVDREGRLSNEGLRAINDALGSLFNQIQQIAELYGITDALDSNLTALASSGVVLATPGGFGAGRTLTDSPTINITDSGPGGAITAAFSGTTSDVPEGSRLYFTDVRARNALSGGTGISYNSGTGQIAVGANGVGNAQLRQSAAFSVIGRSGNTTGDVADITAASDGQVLRRSGSVLGFGAVDLSSAGGVAGILPASKGGTGVNNGTSTLTIIGGFNLSLTLGANSSLTLPASGTIATLAGAETLANKTLSSPTITQTPVYSSAPGANHIADLSGAAISLTNGATVDFPNFSGPIFVNDQGSGGTALYLCGGNNVLSVGASQPIGGTMAFNGGVAGYTFTNTSGGTRTFGFASTKLRAFS